MPDSEIPKPNRCWPVSAHRLADCSMPPPPMILTRIPGWSGNEVPQSASSLPLPVIQALRRPAERASAGRAGASSNGSVVIHAGTALDAQGNLVSAGGRVLTVVGLGEDIEAARGKAYESIAKIQLDGSFYRHDIAASAARLAVS